MLKPNLSFGKGILSGLRFFSVKVLQKIAPTTRKEQIVHYNKKPSYTHFVLRSILCKSCFCCPALLSLDEYNDKVMILTKFLLECVSFAKRNNQIHYVLLCCTPQASIQKLFSGDLKSNKSSRIALLKC